MQYKTFVLELLQQRTELHEQLRKTQLLLPTLNGFAQELRESHLAWKDRLAQANPGGDRSQIASQALEMALKELEDRLSSAPPPDESDAASLDLAMAYLRNPSPRE